MGIKQPVVAELSSLRGFGVMGWRSGGPHRGRDDQASLLPPSLKASQQLSVPRSVLKIAKFFHFANTCCLEGTRHCRGALVSGLRLAVDHSVPSKVQDV